MLDGIFGESMMKRAVGLGAVTFRTIDLRDFTTDKHRTTDDRPYGGGPGMVMKADPIFQAVESVRTPHARILLMSPQGRRFAQSMARELSAEQHVILVCGHYEGIDERVKIGLNAEEVRAALVSTAKDIGPAGDDPFSGAGRVVPAAALALATR